MYNVTDEIPDEDENPGDPPDAVKTKVVKTTSKGVLVK